MRNAKEKIQRLVEMVKQEGLTPMFTHFKINHTTEQKRLIATACVLLDEDINAVARGLTLVSPIDNPNRPEGRYRTLQRAYDALMTRDKEEFELTKTLKKLVPTYGDIGVLLKKVYMPTDAQLSNIEETRIAKKLARAAKKQEALNNV